MNKKPLSIAIQTALCTVLATGAISAQVFAAEQDISKPVAENVSNEETTKVEVDEKITVTGSRLRRENFTVATPLASMGQEAIEDTGIGSLSDILIDELPQISEGTSNSNSQSQVSGTGLSTIDLRELGTSRTLTLIDGRRVVSNSYSGNYVSLSTIPSGLVQKVEVITGGASATYGSDAVAGVVNIITQQDSEGFTAKVRGGESVEGGAKEFGIDLDYGTEFNDGAGYLFVATSYDKEYGMTFDDRDRAQLQDSWDYDEDLMCNLMQTADGDQCMRDITQADWRSLSDSIPGGVFNESSSTKDGGGYWYNSDGYQGKTWKEERDGINTNQFVMLRVPDEKASAAIKIDYDLTDNVMFYGQLQYSYNRSINHKAPESEDECDSVVTRDLETGEFGKDCIGHIPSDNPYMPEEIRNESSKRGDWDRNFAEVGNITTDNKRTTIRSWAGLQGTMFDDSWDWDLSVGYGKFQQRQTRYNEVYVANVRNALHVEDDGNGGYQCDDADARAAGCVPINLFGEGSITTEAADYIRANPTINSDIEQTSVLGYIAGDLFELPAGPVATVFGFEWRKDFQSVSTNVPEGGITFNYVPDFDGDVTVSEVFAEAGLPLLNNVTGVKSLSANVSARLADYSWGGTGLIGSYTAGVIYEPTDGYVVRANWSRAQRAPTITELLSPPRGDYDTFDDICQEVTATSQGTIDDNCRTHPGIAAEIAAEGEFDISDNGYSPGVGNPDLKEETADTVTFGFSIAPEFLEDFSLSVDYYDIVIEDAMSEFDNEDILAFCYDSSLPFGADNSFCQDIKRDPSDGQLIEVQQRVYNVDEIRTSGVDLEAVYRVDLNEFGRLKFKTNWTHVFRYEETNTGPDGQYTEDSLGSLGSDLFEDLASASATWYKDGWRVRWSIKYKSGVVSSHSRYDEFYGEGGIFEEYEANCAADASACVDNPEAPFALDLPSYVRNDLSASYKFDLPNDGEVRLFGGVNNIFDNNGPFIIGGKGNYDSNYGGGKGRFVYLGAEVKF